MRSHTLNIDEINSKDLLQNLDQAPRQKSLTGGAEKPGLDDSSRKLESKGLAVDEAVFELSQGSRKLTSVYLTQKEID